jgi:hypothetical protein
MTGETKPRQGRSPYRARLALVLVSLVLAVVALETAFRTIGGVFQDDFLMPDEVRGWGLRPGFAGWTKEENTLWVEINSAGFRDRERSLAAPANTLRVAMMGDSYTQGMNLPLEKTLPSLLESHLSECAGGRRVEVLNFGVDGYGTTQELLTYRHVAAKYTPDVVVLAVFTANDIYNNDARLSRYPSPQFVFRGDELILDNSFRDSLPPPPPRRWQSHLHEFATRHSRLLWLLDEFRSSFPFGFTAAPSATADVTDPGGLVTAADFWGGAIYRQPDAPGLGEAWRATEGLLQKMAEEVAANGSEFWIVTLANAPQVDPNLGNRTELQDALGVPSLFYPDERIGQFAQRHGIRVMNLAPPLAGHAAAHAVYLNGGYNGAVPLGQGHWNETANELAATLVSKQLCSASPALAKTRER